MPSIKEIIDAFDGHLIWFVIRTWLMSDLIIMKLNLSIILHLINKLKTFVFDLKAINRALQD